MPELKQKKLAIASRIALARKNAGLSQAQVGKMMGLHRPSISELEAGRRNVSSEELVKFAEIFSVSVSWLTCKDEDEHDPKKDRIELAARELSKLKEDDLEKVINLLTSLRQPGDEE
jgi:transcriptional regulator with XRE-family HTH domain